MDLELAWAEAAPAGWDPCTAYFFNMRQSPAPASTRDNINKQANEGIAESSLVVGIVDISVRALDLFFFSPLLPCPRHFLLNTFD